MSPGDADLRATPRCDGAANVAEKDVAENFHAVGAVIEIDRAVLRVVVGTAPLVVVEIIKANPVAEHARILPRLDDSAVLGRGQAATNLVELDEVIVAEEVEQPAVVIVEIVSFHEIAAPVHDHGLGIHMHAAVGAGDVAIAHKIPRRRQRLAITAAENHSANSGAVDCAAIETVAPPALTIQRRRAREAIR